MNAQLIHTYVTIRSSLVVAWQRAVRDESGEGVISAAIAVLVMAFLGVLMWIGFKETLGNAQTNIDDQVNQIGQ